MESMFEEFPDHIKEIVYSKIMYPQPQALLREIRIRGIVRNIKNDTSIIKLMSSFN